MEVQLCVQIWHPGRVSELFPGDHRHSGPWWRGRYLEAGHTGATAPSTERGTCRVKACSPFVVFGWNPLKLWRSDIIFERAHYLCPLVHTDVAFDVWLTSANTTEHKKTESLHQSGWKQEVEKQRCPAVMSGWLSLLLEHHWTNTQLWWLGHIEKKEEGLMKGLSFR